MARYNDSFACPNREETLWGLAYLAFQLVFLPSLLSAVNGILPHKLTQAELNFTFFLLNFLVVMVLLRSFFGASCRHALRHPADACQAFILGVVAYYACMYAVGWAVRMLDPGFVNANDSSISALSKGSWYLMAIGTVVLVPPVEECFYRGLVFRNLYRRNHAAAYLISIAFFALIHIVGFIGSYSPLGLVLCFLQYLPAGLCLAWSYKKGETILVPILIHAFINARSIHLVR